MSPENSVTVWLGQVKAGDPQAAQRIWQRYVDRLVRLASAKLGRSPKRMADEEDVVISAFTAFCRGVEAGRFPDLNDRDDLWQVLVMLTERKAVDQRRHDLADRRGGGKVRGDSIFQSPDNSLSISPGFQQVAASDPTPEFAALMSEELERLLMLLTDDVQREIAVLKMASHSNEEISQSLGISLRSVERKLNLIRQTWQEAKRDE